MKPRYLLAFFVFAILAALGTIPVAILSSIWGTVSLSLGMGGEPAAMAGMLCNLALSLTLSFLSFRFSVAQLILPALRRDAEDNRSKELAHEVRRAAPPIVRAPR